MCGSDLSLVLGFPGSCLKIKYVWYNGGPNTSSLLKLKVPLQFHATPEVTTQGTKLSFCEMTRFSGCINCYSGQGRSHLGTRTEIYTIYIWLK